MSLSDMAPAYVTRKSWDGKIGTYELSMWMSLLVILLVWLNIVVWGIVGVIVAVGVLF